MSKVVLDVTMSLDGFIAGPNDDVNRLHEWIFRDAGAQPFVRGSSRFGRDEVLVESLEATGAVVMGKRTFEIGKGPWGDEPPFQVPCFVLTHQPREKLAKGRTIFNFSTDGIESTLRQAQAAAGERNVALMGADTAQQFLKAGYVDEIQIHLVPILLGGGVRLFDDIGDPPVEMECTRLIDAPGVTHLRYLVAH